MDNEEGIQCFIGKIWQVSKNEKNERKEKKENLNNIFHDIQKLTKVEILTFSFFLIDFAITHFNEMIAKSYSELEKTDCIPKFILKDASDCIIELEKIKKSVGKINPVTVITGKD